MLDDVFSRMREMFYVGLGLLVLGSVWLIYAESTGDIYSNWNIVPFLAVFIGGMLITGGAGAPAGCLVGILFLGLAIKGLTTINGTIALLLVVLAAGCFPIPATATITIGSFAIAVALGFYPTFVSDPNGYIKIREVPRGEFTNPERVVNTALFCVAMLLIGIERAWGAAPPFDRLRNVLRMGLRATAIIAPLGIAAALAYTIIRSM